MVDLSKDIFDRTQVIRPVEEDLEAVVSTTSIELSRDVRERLDSGDLSANDVVGYVIGRVNQVINNVNSAREEFGIHSSLLLSYSGRTIKNTLQRIGYSPLEPYSIN